MAAADRPMDDAKRLIPLGIPVCQRETEKALRNSSCLRRGAVLLVTSPQAMLSWRNW